MKRDEQNTQMTLDRLKKQVETLQQAKEELKKSEEMYRLLTENSVDAVWRLDNKLQFVYVSSAVKNILGYQVEEIIGRSLFSILTPESIDEVKRGYANRASVQQMGQKWEGSTYTVEAIHKDGQRIWVEVTVNPIFDADNRLTGYNGITRDINERRRNETVIRQYAFHDALTNLPNRRLFETVLEKTVARCQQFNKPFAVMFIDVDGLKKINDAYGHSAGDSLLQVVADRLRHGVRRRDLVARLAGDEFIAILPGIGDRNAVNLIATRLIENCHYPIMLGARKASIGVSIGISFFPADAAGIDELISYADQAMYRAKRAGGTNYVCYGQQ